MQYWLWFLLLFLEVCSGDENVSCPVGKDSCKDCYAELVSQITNQDTNLFNLQSSFFPPEAASPLFLTVYYNYRNDTSECSKNDPSNEVWFWSMTSFYLVQPLHVFQYTSMFFSDPESYASDVCLKLHPDCYDAGEDFMRLLTQRLKLYATRTSIASPIDDEYDPKAESVETWNQWHEKNFADVMLIFLNFAFFPIISWFILLFVFLYINHGSPHSRVKETAKIFGECNELKIKEHKFHLQNEFTLSVVFVIAAIVSSSLGAYATAEQTKPPISHYYSCNSTNNTLCLIHTLPYVLLGQDAFIIVTFSILNFVYSLSCIFSERRRSIQGLNLVTLSEGFEELSHSSLYHTKYVKLETDSGNMEDNKKTFKEKIVTAYHTKISSSDSLKWWDFCAYSPLFPFCCLFNHLHYIIISFVHNLSHSTSIAIVYGVVLLFLYSLLKELPHILSACRHCLDLRHKGGGLFCGLQLIKFGVIICLCVYAGFGISLYHFLPIDRGFDDAATNLVTIYHTTIAFLAAIVAYLVIKRPLFPKNETSQSVTIEEDKTQGRGKKCEKEKETSFKELDRTKPSFKSLAQDRNIEVACRAYGCCPKKKTSATSVASSEDNFVMVVRFVNKYTKCGQHKGSPYPPLMIQLYDDNTPNSSLTSTMVPHETSVKRTLKMKAQKYPSCETLKGSICYMPIPASDDNTHESVQFQTCLPYSSLFYKTSCTPEEFYESFEQFSQPQQQQSNEINPMKDKSLNTDTFKKDIQRVSAEFNLTVVELHSNYATLYGKSVRNDNICILLVINESYRDNVNSERDISLIVKLRGNNPELVKNIYAALLKLFETPKQCLEQSEKNDEWVKLTLRSST